MSEEWFIPRQEARDIDLSSSKADYSDGGSLDNQSSRSSSFHSSLCSLNTKWVFVCLCGWFQMHSSEWFWLFLPPSYLSISSLFYQTPDFRGDSVSNVSEPLQENINKLREDYGGLARDVELIREEFRAEIKILKESLESIDKQNRMITELVKRTGTQAMDREDAITEKLDKFHFTLSERLGECEERLEQYNNQMTTFEKRFFIFYVTYLLYLNRLCKEDREREQQIHYHHQMKLFLTCFALLLAQATTVSYTNLTKAGDFEVHEYGSRISKDIRNIGRSYAANLIKKETLTDYAKYLDELQVCNWDHCLC
eukprot:sb/3467098/